MTNEEAVTLMGYLVVAFPNAKMDVENVKAYCRYIVDLPFAQAKEAAESLCTTSKYLPSIAELREETVKRIPGAYIPSTSEAWTEVSQAIKHGKIDQAPTFSHQLISHVVRVMGWFDLLHSEQPLADRAHFMRLYSDLREDAWKQARVKGAQHMLSDVRPSGLLS